VLVADAYPNFSICGLPSYCRGDVTEAPSRADLSSAGWAFNPGAPVFRPGAEGPGQRSQAIGARGSGR
jgi:hypothetical protein